MSERRRSSRYPVDAPARLQPVGGGLLEAQAYSLALGGVSLRARCRVTRCTVLDPGPGYRIAVVFERLDQRAMALLQRYFSARRGPLSGTDT